MCRERRPRHGPHELHIGVALFQLFFLRAVTDHHFRARQLERQKRIMIFLNGDPTDRRKNRTRQIQGDGTRRIE